MIYGQKIEFLATILRNLGLEDTNLFKLTERASRLSYDTFLFFSWSSNRDCYNFRQICTELQTSFFSLLGDVSSFAFSEGDLKKELGARRKEAQKLFSKKEEELDLRLIKAMIDEVIDSYVRIPLLSALMKISPEERGLLLAFRDEEKLFRTYLQRELSHLVSLILAYDKIEFREQTYQLFGCSGKLKGEFLYLDNLWKTTKPEGTKGIHDRVSNLSLSAQKVQTQRILSCIEDIRRKIDSKDYDVKLIFDQPPVNYEKIVDDFKEALNKRVLGVYEEADLETDKAKRTRESIMKCLISSPTPLTILTLSGKLGLGKVIINLHIRKLLESGDIQENVHKRDARKVVYYDKKSKYDSWKI